MTIDTNTVPLTTLAQAIMRDTLRGRQQRDVSPTQANSNRRGTLSYTWNFEFHISHK